MAKQQATSAERQAVDDVFNRYQLPVNADLNQRDNAVYGLTDPAIALSMVNVRHMTATRKFKGEWSATGIADGNNAQGMALNIPFVEGDVVIGSTNGNLYRLKTGGTATDNPEMDTTETSWQLLSRPLDLPIASLTGGTTNNLPLYSPHAYTLNYGVDRGTVGTVTATTTPATTPAITGTSIAGTVTPVDSASGSFVVSASSDVTDVNGVHIHPGIAATHTFNFTDQRRMPVITPAALAVPSVGTITDPFTIDLAPDGTLANGFAYDINSAGIQVGSNTVTGNSYLPTGLSSSTSLSFTFPVVNNTTNNQPVQTLSIPVMAEVYQPFFYGAQAAAPSTITGLTRSTTGVPGATPTSITITGTAGDPIYVLVPASTTSVTSMIGAAQVPGTLVTSNIMVAGNNGQQFVYHSYRFGALFGSSVTLNLISS